MRTLAPQMLRPYAVRLYNSIMEVKGKTALITGAARRLGRAAASHLAKRGCSVVAHYYQSAKEAESLKDETGCRLFQADFASIRIRELREKLEDEVGAVDILINNASSFQRSDWQEIDESLWDHEMTVNFKVPFFLSQHFGRIMKSRKQGKIIQMIDIASERAYMNYLPYSLAKSGLAASTRALARALAPEVQVNGIAPSTILFPDGTPEQSMESMIKKIPARRTARVDEFLRTVDFLLSDVDYITGQILNLDGGRTLTW